MMAPSAALARRMLEQTGQHPVISLIFDLDPSRFATADARATQARSLLDRLREESRADTSLSHEDRVALVDDLARLDSYLNSGEPPVEGARALAIFCSGQDELFEAVPLTQPAPHTAVIARTPRVEPLVAGHDSGRWCLALVNRREARLFEGSADSLQEADHLEDNVQGRHRKGGWSQANYERHVDEEADAHLRRVARELHERWQAHPFQTLVLGGPEEVVSRFEAFLHNDVRRLLHPRRVHLDLSSADDAEVQAAASELQTAIAGQFQQSTLEELQARLGRHTTAAAGLADTLAALNERRVQTLVLDANFQADARRCPRCGMLTSGEMTRCPAEGSPLEPLSDVREAAVERTLLQDGEILVASEPPEDLMPEDGIGALLRF